MIRLQQHAFWIINRAERGFQNDADSMTDSANQIQSSKSSDVVLVLSNKTTKCLVAAQKHNLIGIKTRLVILVFTNNSLKDFRVN